MTYAPLFQPIKIGAKTAKNRFYQVPHCNGGGYRDPSAAAAMRGVKAEGGWGVIFTEQTEMHHTSEITPFIELRLWEDKDIPSIAKMAAAMKTHGALAGIQLAYSGINGPNLYSRDVPLAVTFNQLRRHPLPPFRPTAGFSATASLSRAEFGIDAWPSAIGDRVELRIEAEATRSGERHARGDGAAPSGDLPAPAAHDGDRDDAPSSPPNRQEPATP